MVENFNLNYIFIYYVIIECIGFMIILCGVLSLMIVPEEWEMLKKECENVN